MVPKPLIADDINFFAKFDFNFSKSLHRSSKSEINKIGDNFITKFIKKHTKNKPQNIYMNIHTGPDYLLTLTHVHSGPPF